MFQHLPDQIVYIRHPECIHNRGYEAYDAALARGISNRASPLTGLGEAQAEITTAYLRENFSFDLIVSSDFFRAQTIPRLLGQTFVVDSRLGERWHGELHERGSVFFEENPEERFRYENDYYHYQAPGGESCLDVERRIYDFFMKNPLLQRRDSVLLSGHGISGLCLRKVLFDASFEDWQDWFNNARLNNASVTVYERNMGRYQIALYNHMPWKGKLNQLDGVEA